MLSVAGVARQTPRDGLKEISPPFIDFDQPVPTNETLWDWSRS